MSGYITVEEKRKEDCRYFMNLCDYMYSTGCDIDDMALTVHMAILETLGLYLSVTRECISRNFNHCDGASIKVVAGTDSEESLLGINLIEFHLSCFSKSCKITINIRETLEYLLYESGKLEDCEEVYVSKAWMNPLMLALSNIDGEQGFRYFTMGYNDTSRLISSIMRERSLCHDF